MRGNHSQTKSSLGLTFFSWGGHIFLSYNELNITRQDLLMLLLTLFMLNALVRVLSIFHGWRTLSCDFVLAETKSIFLRHNYFNGGLAQMVLRTIKSSRKSIGFSDFSAGIFRP